MQVITVLLFTMATLSLLSSAVHASPIFTIGDDESSMKNLRALAVKQDKEYKRICGMSLYGCRVKESFVLL